MNQALSELKVAAKSRKQPERDGLPFRINKHRQGRKSKSLALQLE